MFSMFHAEKGEGLVSEITCATSRPIGTGRTVIIVRG